MIHLRKLGINILKEADQVIFLSVSYRDQTIEKYVPKHLQKAIYNKVSIIPNGIDNFWFKNIATTKKTLEIPNLKLLQVGDINKNKNIETTVKAVDTLISNGYNVKLSIVGKVKDQKIYNKIKDLDYVDYLGYRSKEELISIYRDNDIFVMPSIHETFGLVYPEAMSQGLPVIYTRGQGFDGQFEDGEVGFAVNCFDSNEIAERIIDINENYNKISNCCIRLVDKFDWVNISKKYKTLYSVTTK